MVFKKKESVRPLPTLIIIAKVTVRTRTIDLNVLLGGGTKGVGVGVDVDGSSLNFSMEHLLLD